MNLDSLSFTLTQINYLIVNLNKKNYRDSTEEISVVSFSQQYLLLPFVDILTIALY